MYYKIIKKGKECYYAVNNKNAVISPNFKRLVDIERYLKHVVKAVNTSKDIDGKVVYYK